MTSSVNALFSKINPNKQTENKVSETSPVSTSEWSGQWQVAGQSKLSMTSQVAQEGNVTNKVSVTSSMTSSTTSPHASSLSDPVKAAIVRKKLGFLSTWNESCGLATYARYLLNTYPEGSYVVLAEKTSCSKIAPDESYVVRCWEKTAPKYDELIQAVQDYELGLLHINCQASFFQQPEFTACLKKIRSQGVKIVAQLHNVFTLETKIQQLVTSVDKIIVHSPENALEAIANGCSPEKIQVIRHGVHVSNKLSDSQKRDLKTELKIPQNASLITSFGFLQPHKGMHAVAEGVSQLRKKGLECYGLICGSVMESDSNSLGYVEKLKDYIKQEGLSTYVRIIEGFLSDEEVTNYLQVADIVLMNYQSQYYESSGACALAVGAGAVVATSLSPSLMSFGSAVWHITAGYPLSLSLELLLTDKILRADILKNASQYCESYRWEKVKNIFLESYISLGFEPCVETNNAKVKPYIVPSTNTRLKVLMQNRTNAFSQPGGDTVVMEKTIAGLRARGVDVVVDLQGRENPQKYHLVHLYNFALPQMLQSLGQRALEAKIPFVVTTLNEDVGNFHTQSHAVSESLVEYIKRGQDREWFSKNWKDPHSIPGCGKFENSFIVKNAAALLTNGVNESKLIQIQYPGTCNMREVKLGFEVRAKASSEVFTKEYGVKDFILCVGRLESRKNQLMLLKALEDVDLPVVLLGGGFSYQPFYEQAVKNFKRKGKTLVLGRLSSDMLASAYAAAKVHALPSWYELPGLVSLEAASCDCNVVVTPYGTAWDYLGNKAFYCEPESETSIYNAVLAAYYSPLVPGLKETVNQYTWDKVAENTLKVYEEVLKLGSRVETMPSTISTSGSSNDYEKLLEEGENTARTQAFEEALKIYERAEKINASTARLWKGRGVIYLAQNKHLEAQKCFERGLRYDPQDTRIICGIGMCEVREQKWEQAYTRFLKLLEQEPSQITAIHELIRCSYALNRFNDLEKVISSYLSGNPGEAQTEMEFCLAGCLFKLEKYEQSEAYVSKVLKANPTHKGALELKDHVSKSKSSKLLASLKPTVSLGSGPVNSGEPAFNDIDTKIMSLEEDKRKKKYDSTGKSVAELLRLKSLSAEQRERLLILQAEINLIDDKHEEAQRGLEEVLSRNPRSARALCGLGALSAHRNGWKVAEKHFEEALLIQPEYDVALAGLALCAVQANNQEKAWDYYVRANRQNPENMRALLGILEIGYPMGRLSQIETALTAYLDIHPADLEILYSLSGCYFAQNKIREASSELDKILLLKPSYERAQELKRIIQEKHQGQVREGAGGSRVAMGG